MSVHPMMLDFITSFLAVLICIVVGFYVVTYLCAMYRRQPDSGFAGGPQGHHWTVVDLFKPGFYCNICSTSLFYGVECDYCGVVADLVCVKNADKDLTCKQVSIEGELLHHWIHGNLPINSICGSCEKDCGSGPGLVDYRCCWCQRTVHESCLRNLDTSCDLGKYVNFIVPPNCVEMHRNDWNVSNHPMFKHVFDLWYDHPCLKLQMLHAFEKGTECYILVAGGDGSFGWVLDSVEGIASSSGTPAGCKMALLPLGTGNDLCRVLGWKDGSINCAQADFVFSLLSQAESTLLDRWLVVVSPSSFLGAQTFEPVRKMNNYLSIGVDAQVTLNFHRQRNSIPRALSSRFMNKFLFFVYGAKDVLEHKCRNLHLCVELKLDGRLIELPKLEAIVLLNIACWGAGVRPWQLGKGGPTQSMNDGILEVFGVYSSFHIAQMQVGLSEPYRIGQAKEVIVKIKEGLFPIQIDGEPWHQGPSTIKVTPFGQCSVLCAKRRESGQSECPVGQLRFGLF